MFRFFKIRKQKSSSKTISKAEFHSQTKYCTMFESDDENAVGKIVLPLSFSNTYVQTHERNKC